MHPAVRALLAISFAGYLSSQPNTDLRAFENRYEGLLRLPVGNDALTLVSFIDGAIPAYVVTSELQALQVTFSAPSAARAQIIGQELRPIQLYRMESFPCVTATGANLFGPWPVKAVLGPKGIDHRNLGVVVQLGPRQTDPVTPARVRLGESEGITDSTYSFVFRPGRSLSAVEYAFSSASEMLLKGTVIDPLVRNEPFTVRIPRPAWPSGTYTLTLTSYLESTKQQFATAIAFYHARNANPQAKPCGVTKGD